MSEPNTTGALVGAIDESSALSALEARVTAQAKTIATLVERAEGTQTQRSSAFALFESNLGLERLVSDKTRELREQSAALADALEALKQTKAQLVQSEKLQAIGALAAGVAHEINTPTQYVSDNVAFLARAFDSVMAVVAAAGSVAASDAGSDGFAEASAGYAAAVKRARLDFIRREVPLAAEQAREGLARIATIVGALNEYAHPGNGTREPVDLEHVLRMAIEVGRSQWKYVAEVVLETEPSLPTVVGVRDELNQVFLNLLVNAAHAIADVVRSDGQKGQIRIGARSEAGGVVVTISDTGIGMSDRVLRRIFEPFFTTKGVGRGTGQGLAIAYAVVVERHGGRIEVDSAEGKGSTFFVHLPFDLDPAEQRAGEPT